ncbi:hypothetical protein HJC06_30085 [Rhizobium sp. NLR9b]|uniref:hypothetical protein n=1 Tax=unclassified Rhizobium TaxID=2613769 RepID=UPI001C834E05|nr:MULTISPECIES: hypothetical protein [unclassified Rhizobium]MBX5230596.1 hypothetical protein [Rhizobium sp. NLR9b]MBX5291264.1 hypothetical protein [Rhizobium sp. NLR10b]
MFDAVLIEKSDSGQKAHISRAGVTARVIREGQVNFQKEIGAVIEPAAYVDGFQLGWASDDGAGKSAFGLSKEALNLDTASVAPVSTGAILLISAV